jgi:ribosomal protein S18 acetylase RimI-like enzyme
MAAGYDDLVIEDADTDLAKEVATSALVGFCATSPVREDGVVAPHGEIRTIGVRLDRQGAGLGRQLLCWGARRLGSVGVTDISRAVNGRNDRALGLFESEGFIRSRTRERWSRRVEAGSAQGETP